MRFGNFCLSRNCSLLSKLSLLWYIVVQRFPILSPWGPCLQTSQFISRLVSFSYHFAKNSQWHSPHANNIYSPRTQSYYIHDIPLTNVFPLYIHRWLLLYLPLITVSSLPMPHILCINFFLAVSEPTSCTNSCISWDRLGFAAWYSWIFTTTV